MHSVAPHMNTVTNVGLLALLALEEQCRILYYEDSKYYRQYYAVIYTAV